MKFGKNDEAVSPVIGVILMVAITVILAAVIAAFVFGMGPPVKAPQTQLKITAVYGNTTGYIKISHDGGDSLVLKDEKITLVNAANDTLTIDGLSSIALYGNTTEFQSGTAVQTLAAGSSILHNWGATTSPNKGDILLVRILDTPSGQLIASTKVTVT